MITFNPLGYHGRLGNQLYQLAATIGIARTLGQEFRLPDDWAYRKFFSVPDEFFAPKPLKGQEAHETELVNHIDPRARIYLQDFGLWNHVSDEVRQYLEPSSHALDLIRGSLDGWLMYFPKKIASLHVRRGDNVTNPAGTINLVPRRYYKDALTLLPSDTETVVCFSDDPGWCKQNFGPSVMYYDIGVPRPKEHEPDFDTAPVLDWIDLMLMTYADYHIISNSTYAWWGAYLSGDEHPMYPSYWFGYDYINESLLFPPGWRKIEC